MTVFKMVLISALAAALCFGYWRYRGIEARQGALQHNQQDIEQVRRELRDLEIRLKQARERIQALENDPVEAEAAARRIGRTVKSKAETVFHLDESRMTPGSPPESAAKPAETPAPASPAVSAPTQQQAAPPGAP